MKAVVYGGGNIGRGHLGQLLYESGFEIVFVDERMSSGMVEKMLVREFDLSRGKRKAILDKVAAAEILQRVLDAF